MKTSKLKDVDLAEFEKLAGLLTVEQMGDFYGLTRDSMHRNMRNRADLRAAFKRGQAKKIAMVAGTLMNKVREGDVASIIFFLKTKAGWSEKIKDAEEELIKAQTKLTKTNVAEAVKELERLGVRLPDFANEPAPKCPQTKH
ncbi:hypothetical protein [Thiolapillus sp.]|uniref:hypothetical protein n=1 Tax=Thiolapillus sp. TaxID=2017437 RepID=UPI003AF7F7B0